MQSGAIEKGSQAYNDMQMQIQGVVQAILSCIVSIIKFAAELKKIRWENFDFIQDQISTLTDESDFLIDLLSRNDLFDKAGKMTEEGMSVIGLHAMNYDVYMRLADEYAKELENVSDATSEDIERRNELLEQQRKSIKAAEDEKKQSLT